MLARRRPHVIGVTGSVGKTSTKDSMAAALTVGLSIRKNEKSYNSELGVPLTVLGLKSAWGSPIGWFWNILLGAFRAALRVTRYQYLVLELGADKPGDIDSLVNWLKPEIGVLTGFGGEVPVHVEFFQNIESLVAEKGKLLEALPEYGMAVINRDDARAWEMRGLTKARLVSFGTSAVADVRAEGLRISYDERNKPKGLSFRVDVAGKSIPVRLFGVLGKGHMYAALAAIAVASELGLNLLKVVAALEAQKAPSGRLCLLAGINDCTIIDDTYNSSPAAVKLALETLHDLELPEASPPGTGALSSGKPRKIAVLGDMMELGKYSQEEHRKVGSWLPGVADVLVCVGERAKWIGESAAADGFPHDHVHYFPDSKSTGLFLSKSVHPGDLVLLKASQSIRLERATEMLLADRSKAGELLVRQDKEWKRK